MSNAISIVAVTALGALLASVSADVVADNGGAGNPTVTVRYSDLNLDTAAGTHVLYQRLKAASRQVCRALEGRELDRYPAWRSCYDQALADAMAQVDAPQLTTANGQARARALPPGWR